MFLKNILLLGITYISEAQELCSSSTCPQCGASVMTSWAFWRQGRQFLRKHSISCFIVAWVGLIWFGFGLVVSCGVFVFFFSF